MKTLRNLTLLLATVAYTACDDNTNKFDATGSFEANETIISAESSGKLMAYSVDEGQVLQKGQYLGFIDTTQLALSRKQVFAQMDAILSRKPDVAVQLTALKEQLKAAEVEQKRMTNLLKADAATPKQMDDVNGQIDIINGNITALRNSLNTSTRSIDREIDPLKIQVEQINDQIEKSKLVNPVEGTVLISYVETFEQVGKGTPLYKIADLSELTLRAYVTGNQLPLIKLNQQVKVLTDDGNGGYKETQGVIYWISDKAEFTPKTVQTKDERANKVYGIKVRVVNDGFYKIGMYGEINF